jgi:hypothetical protein
LLALEVVREHVMLAAVVVVVKFTILLFIFQQGLTQ